MAKSKKVEPEQKSDGVVVKPDTSGYTNSRSASGAKTLHNGDPVAVGLAGATLEEAYSLAEEALETPVKDLKAKYGHLNDGMQRMNLGNRLRGVVNKMNKEKDGSGDKWAKSFFSGVQQAVKERAKAAEAEKKAKAEKAA